MKKIILFLTFFLSIHGIIAQNHLVQYDATNIETPPQYDILSGGRSSRVWYFDMNLGYFPDKHNASWAAKVSSGHCFNEQSGIGVGLGVFGRENIFKRSAMGLGFQYRHNYPERLIVKVELGYLIRPKMHDGSLNKDMIYVESRSKPIYFQLEAQWRLWRSLTLGIAAVQSGDLYFNRYIDETRFTQDLWHINALTVQLGFIFN